MSYARWGEDGSSVYLFAHVDGFVECCGCSFETRDTEPYQNFFGQVMTVTVGSAALHSAVEVVAHMRAHIAAGEEVPAYLLHESLYPAVDFQQTTRAVTHG